MYVEDLDLRLADEHARVHSNSGSVRTVTNITPVARSCRS